MRLVSALAVVFLLVPLMGQSQYIQNTSQAFQFAPLLNPAFTGIENFGDLKVGYRYQWTAFGDNAPKFGTLSYSTRIKQPLNLKVNALRTSRTDFKNIVPKRKLNVHGGGINIYNESYGAISKTGGGIHHAIHFPLSERVSISGGTGLVVESTRLRSDKLYWGENAQPDAWYDKLSGSGNQTDLRVRLGVLVYSDNFYVGGSYTPVSAEIAKSDIDFLTIAYKGTLQAGVAFPLNEDLMLKPSVVAFLQHDGNILIDYAAKFYMQDKVWFGLTYRDVKSGIGSAGFNINEKFSAAYSYEFSLGKLRTFSGGSHELILAMRVNNLKRVNQYTW